MDPKSFQIQQDSKELNPLFLNMVPKTIPLDKETDMGRHEIVILK
jgi:hypothetical protein